MHKEKKTRLCSTILLFQITYSAIMESTMTHAHCFPLHLHKAQCMSVLHQVLSIMVEDMIWKRRVVELSCYFCFLCAQKVFLYLHKIKVELLMSHGLFYRCPYYVSWSGNISVTLLSMEGQKALGFHQKYLHLFSEDERRSYEFGTTWGWVINDNIFILGWAIPLIL